MKRFFYVTLITLFTVSVFFAAHTVAGEPEGMRIAAAETAPEMPGDEPAADTGAANDADADPAVTRERALPKAQTVAVTVAEPEEERSHLQISLSGAITDTEAEEKMNSDTAFPYYVKVNRMANTVTVYGMDSDGAYTVPYKAFVCSAGEYTPLGTYRTSTKARWLALVGGVWGQYTTRITGPYWFHSVPYFTQTESDIEYLEYNKLGNLASLGCIRMTVEDVKWIYDACPAGTTVELYDDPDNPGPLGKPVPPLIGTESEKRGWDPTDPHPDNPWRQLYAPSYPQQAETGREKQ
ncbi:MAG: L,D-transpeptidase [Lachnospiraceae bacterium]|nr:L,D-transpeptidase [Lachnospiraceae bacterium]